jgi:hypothetical protein
MYANVLNLSTLTHSSQVIAIYMDRNFTDGIMLYSTNGLQLPSSNDIAQAGRHMFCHLNFRYSKPRTESISDSEDEDEKGQFALRRTPNPVDRAVWSPDFVAHKDLRVTYNQHDPDY